VAIETLQSHVLMAMQFKDDLPNLWYGMAHTTPWSDEEIPPAEDILTSNLGGVIGFKKFDKAQLVVPLTASGETDPTTGNEVVYKSQSWEIVSDDQAVEKGARWVYLEVTINPGDLPYSVYRQVGVYKNLKLQTASMNKPAVRPTEVLDQGVLMAYDNRRFQRYDDNVTIKEQIVIKF